MCGVDVHDDTRRHRYPFWQFKRTSQNKGMGALMGTFVVPMSLWFYSGRLYMIVVLKSSVSRGGQNYGHPPGASIRLRTLRSRGSRRTPRARTKGRPKALPITPLIHLATQPKQPNLPCLPT